MNLKNLVGKQIVSIYEGEIVGTIIRANFNTSLTKITGFVVFDEEDDEFFLPMRSVVAMGDCVLIRNKSVLNSVTTWVDIKPLGYNIYDEKANNLGIIEDASVDEKGNILNYFTSLEKEIKPDHLIQRKSFILHCNKKISMSDMRPRRKTYLEKIKVNVLNTDITQTENFIPSKLKYNPQSLLGKVSKGDLVGLNNELIIKANQSITEKTIQDATRHNRLNQLYYLAN